MKPTDQLTSNIKLSDMSLFLKNANAGSSANQQLSALLAISNSGRNPESDLTYLDIMPGYILQLITRATPLTDRKALSDSLNESMGQKRYIAKELKLSEFIINKVSRISSLKEFFAARRSIPALLRSDQGRALEALSGSILNLSGRKKLRRAIIAFIKEATSLCGRHPSLKNLIAIFSNVKNNSQLIRDFSYFLHKQLEIEKNCLEISIKYGVTDESIMHDLEHKSFELLSDEEIGKNHSHEEIAHKYGLFESCVLELLEHKFVEYRPGVEVLKGGSTDSVAVRYNITTSLGRNRLNDYNTIATKIIAGGNCFKLGQSYNIDLRNKKSRVAMEELSIKHAAGAALLGADNWRSVANKYGILTKKSRKILAENFLSVRTVRQNGHGNPIIRSRSYSTNYHPYFVKNRQNSMSD